MQFFRRLLVHDRTAEQNENVAQCSQREGSLSHLLISDDSWVENDTRCFKIAVPGKLVWSKMPTARASFLSEWRAQCEHKVCVCSLIYSHFHTVLVKVTSSDPCKSFQNRAAHYFDIQHLFILFLKWGTTAAKKNISLKLCVSPLELPVCDGYAPRGPLTGCDSRYMSIIRPRRSFHIQICGRFLVKKSRESWVRLWDMFVCMSQLIVMAPPLLPLFTCGEGEIF